MSRGRKDECPNALSVYLSFLISSRQVAASFITALCITSAPAENTQTFQDSYKISYRFQKSHYEVKI